VESVLGRNLNLVGFEAVIPELNDSAAFGANHVVMVIAEVEMFVTHNAVVKSALACKPQTAQQFQGIAHKLRAEFGALRLESVYQLVYSDVFFNG
jgi:hypothetical protein